MSEYFFKKGELRGVKMDSHLDNYSAALFFPTIADNLNNYDQEFDAF